MRGWSIILGLVIGCVGFMAVALWTYLVQTARDPFTAKPSASIVLPSWPSSDERTSPDGPRQSGTLRRLSPPAQGGPLPPSFGPLFTALGLHQPSQWSPAPDFALQNLSGQPVRLRQFQGKLVLLNFWATWCAPCLVEMPSMERLYQTFKQTEFVLLAVSLDRQGAPAVESFVQEMQLTFPILLDSTSEIGRSYGVRGLPSTYLIDPDGQLIGAAVGARDWARTEAKALIAGLLRQAAAPPHDSTEARP
jgi:peroxiredoxin